MRLLFCECPAYRLAKKYMVLSARLFDMELRAVIKFYLKSGKTATEVYQDLKNLYIDD